MTAIQIDGEASIPASGWHRMGPDAWLSALVSSIVVYLFVMACVHAGGINVVRSHYVNALHPEMSISRDTGQTSAPDSTELRQFSATYGAIQVAIESKPVSAAERGLVWAAAFAVSILVVRRSRRVRGIFPRLRGVYDRSTTVEKLFFLALGVLVYFKLGIIDMRSFAGVISGLPEGVNFYYVSLLQGRGGHLPIFPYSPISYIYFSMISEAQLLIDSLGLRAHPHALLQLSFLVAYCWLVRELVCVARHAGVRLLSGKGLCYFIFFNPMALYYVLGLGQIDLFAVVLLVAGLRRLFDEKNWSTAFVLLLGALVSGKPQHLLVLPVLFALGMCIERGADIRRYYLFMIGLTVSALLVSASFRLLPGFYESLGENPQVPRLVWSTWWTMLSDSIVINRPIGFMVIATMLLIYLLPAKVADDRSLTTLALLGTAILVAAFQASFAHTFGMAIFLFPAIVLLSLSSASLVKAILLSAISIGLLATWGTGLVGDFTNALGYHILSSPGLPGMLISGFTYSSIMHSIESALYLAYLVLFFAFLSKIGTGLEK